MGYDARYYAWGMMPAYSGIARAEFNAGIAAASVVNHTTGPRRAVWYTRRNNSGALRIVPFPLGRAWAAHLW